MNIYLPSMRLWRLIKLLIRFAFLFFIFSVAVEFMRYVIHVYSTDTYFIEDTASLNHYIREKETVPTTLRLEPQWTCDLDYNCSYGKFSQLTQIYCGCSTTRLKLPIKGF